MCSHDQSQKLIHVSGVHCHMCVSSTSGCSFVYLTIQYSIEYGSTVSLLQAQDVQKLSVKSRGNVPGTARKCLVITTETKMKIIERVEHGEKMVDTACSYNMNCSTIGIILKNKEHVKSDAPNMSTIISKKHGKVMEEMEKFVSVCVCGISIKSH